MNLLASTLFGGLYLFLLFGICFGCVAGAKALRIELKKRETVHTKKSRESDPPATAADQSEKHEKKQPQTVYYIVEKKRARPKNNYGEPKEIKFR